MAVAAKHPGICQDGCHICLHRPIEDTHCQSTVPINSPYQYCARCSWCTSIVAEHRGVHLTYLQGQTRPSLLKLSVGLSISQEELIHTELSNGFQRHQGPSPQGRCALQQAMLQLAAGTMPTHNSPRGYVLSGWTPGVGSQPHELLLLLVSRGAASSSWGAALPLSPAAASPALLSGVFSIAPSLVLLLLGAPLAAVPVLLLLLLQGPKRSCQVARSSRVSHGAESLSMCARSSASSASWRATVASSRSSASRVALPRMQACEQRCVAQ